jgi:RNA polymerase sigma-70 factor (ECF subfamily)
MRESCGETPGDLASANPAEWIVAVAQDGDRACFALLFERFAPKVKSYYLRMGTADELAEELAQETLLAIWRKADRFDPLRASAWGWIFTIARNLRIDVLRHERHPDDLRVPTPAAEQPTPEEEYCSIESEDRLRSALKALPPDHSEVLHLAFFEERSQSEIAERLGLPLGTVKSRIRRAAARLRSTLDE